MISVQHVSKNFPGVKALDDVTFTIHSGEVHGLVGENGAGKSTLIRIVTGAHPPDEGRVVLNGAAVRLAGPASALASGVAAIYQELSLVPAMSVRENLFLGREPVRRGFIDRKAERRAAREVLARIGAEIDTEARVDALNVARRQMVEIARALSCRARLLIMDEPTAALTPREADRLFERIAELRREGIGVVFVTHRLEEVFRVADRVTVMRDGATLGTWIASDLDRKRLVELMVGRPLDQEFPKVAAPLGKIVLEVRDLAGGRVRGVSFHVREGEVLGIAGLVGAGRTDLARLIFGADRPDRGEIRLGGRAVTVRSPRDAIRLGIGLLTEDRKAQGLVLGLTARENFALPNLMRWSRLGWIFRRREAAAFQRRVGSLGIRLAGPDQPAGHLSGGNQQKLLIARWLESDCRVLIFDEPTRGVDVGARHEIYLLLNDLAAHGKAMIMISSELPELLGVSDRILVMHDGRITGEITDVAAATQEQVLALAVG